jgi:beta-glucanase (GH16 family)
MFWANPRTASAADIVRDDFNGGSLNSSIWNIGTWSLGRTQLGFTPQITGGIARLRLDTYNPTNPGGSFKGTEIWTGAQYTRGANGLEMEARVRVNPLPSGLVTSFFTYGARTQFNPPLADEIDFEHVSKMMNAAPAGSKPILLTTWNDYRTDGSNFGDPNIHSSQSIAVPGWDPTQFNTYRIRWLGNRVEWYVNGALTRTSSQAVSTDPMNVRLNFWAPANDWTDAYSSSLVPVNNSGANTTYLYDVDFVSIRNGYNPVAASAPNRVFTDHFKNASTANSDSVNNFWSPRNLGPSSTVSETTGDPLKMTAVGAGYPHAQLTSAVRSELNFFDAPIRITADGIAFNSTSNSYGKSILRCVLSSEALPTGGDSEYTADDAFSLRLGGDNSVVLGYKLNQPNTNSEFNTNLLNTIVSGPVRHFALTLRPGSFTLAVEHETSATDGTRITDTFTGGLSIDLADWNGLTGNAAMFLQTQLNDAVAGEITTGMIDSLSVDSVRSSWLNDASGNWNSGASWSADGVPDFSGANVIFGNVISLPRNVSVNAPVTAGVLQFDSPQRYTLSGSTITLNTPAASAAINVVNGSHTISAPLEFSSDLSVNVTPPGATLELGNVSGAGNLTKLGAGHLQAAKMDIAGLNVSAGRVTLLNSGAGTVRNAVSSLDVAPGATLDLLANAMVVDHTGASVATSVRGLLITGRGSGTWNATGLTSSAADGTHTALGYAEAAALGGSLPAVFGSVDGSAILVRYTLLGDADLNAAVDTLDFNFLAASFGQSSQSWINGDFNYDGSVDTVDFNFLANNFGAALAAAGAGTLVPEPSGIPALVLLSLPDLLRGRRRRASQA